MYVDTHTHLTDSAFDEDRRAVLERAISSGVSKMVLTNIDEYSFDALFDFTQKYPQNCFPTVGIHPTCINATWSQQMEFVGEILKHHHTQLVAVGEIGLDLYWDKTYKLEQRLSLLTQIDLALCYGLPVIFHIREAFDFLFDCISEIPSQQIHCVFHAFSGSKEIYEKLADLFPNAYFGIGGVITYGTKLHSTAQHIPLSRIVLETDAPYLTPVPHRGSRNESSYIPHIAEKLALLKGYSVSECARITTENAMKLFALTQNS